ncbi:MAG: DHHA1 domain-containing protein [Thermoplasmatota archaeon]
MSLDQAASRAAQLIRSHPSGTRWFLDCDTDADGLTAAVVMARALGRIGHRFQVRASREKDTAAYEALAQQECEGFILLDKGTSHVATLASFDRPVVVVDHHNVPDVDAGDVVLVNPRLEGMDGSRDASAATTAVAVALALDDGNLDLAPIGLSGAVGDWQHHGGWQGWNRDLVDRCLAAGHLDRRVMPALIGVDLGEALGRLGLGALVDELGLDARLDAEDLDVEAATQLVSAWTLHDLEQGIERTRVQEILWNVKLGLGVRHAFRIVDACGRLGRADTGIAFLMGSASARDAAREVFADYKNRLGQALALLKEGTSSMEALQWAAIGEPALTGMVAGLGVVHFLQDTAKPLVVVAPRDDGQLQVSTRGDHGHVASGLDLGAAIQEAAAGVGAEGGGHPIASGAVIDPDQRDAFLQALDAALKRQGFLDGP